MIKEIYKTIKSIEGLEENSDKVKIIFTDGTFISQWHEQDCCEEVCVAQVDGGLLRHINAEAFCIEEKIVYDDINHESYTASFYTLKTSKGYLDWRWDGMSNGYYSESVEMYFDGKFVEL